MPTESSLLPEDITGSFPRKLSRRATELIPVRNHHVEIPILSRPNVGADDLNAGGLSYYWFILRRHTGLWILFAFLGALLGVLVAVPQTPVYRAHGSVEILDLNENFLNLKQATPVAENGAATDWDIQTEIKILQSESLKDRVIARLQKASPPAAEEASDESSWRKALNLTDHKGATAYEQLLGKAAKSLKIHAAGQTRILEITADSTNRELAANFVNTLANEFIEQSLESRWRVNERTNNWLSRQLDDMRIKLERSEDSLQGYARSSGLVFTDEKTNVSEEKLRQLQEELSKAEGERIAKQSVFELAQTSAADVLPDVLNDTGLQETQAKLTDLRQQAAELKTIYTPEHVKVKRVQAQISALEAVFDHDRNAIVNRIRTEYQESERKEKLLGAAYAAQTKLVTGEGEKAIQYNILKREVDTNRQIYEAMLQQLKESSIASAMRASNIRVLDPAKIPFSAFKPNPRQSGVLGLLAGLFLGTVFILMRDRMDRTIQQPGDSALYLNAPELGVIPSAAKNPVRHTGIKAESICRSASSTKSNGSGRVELATWNQKPSLVADSFRSILISILLSGDGAAGPKSIVLTSGSPGEGKSTVTSNLAIALAEAGQRVLLIDADLRRPRQHEIFSVNNKRGVTTILRSEEQLLDIDAVETLVRPTDVPGLYILTSGPPSASATNLLCGPLFPELLAYFRGEFETVLIDTPPMLQIPDARILGRLADGVILVIRAGQTTREAALAARRRFSQDGTNLIGTILNDWNAKHSPSGYYGSHENYYQTASGEVLASQEAEI
jgi:capsular exopolysaccharide synthesis family protein